MRGNCYVTTEALWHILGGQRGPWVVMRMWVKGDTHWFLQHCCTGVILDASRRQFKQLPDYSKAKHAAFLTKRPSKRARKMIFQLTWSVPDAR